MPFTHRPAMDERQLAQIMTKARVLVETGFFDEVYYTENNAMPPGMDLFEHFFLTGYKEGRRPNAVFDPLWYLATYLEVAASGFNPLLEYALISEKEGRNPSPLFDAHDLFRFAMPQTAKISVVVPNFNYISLVFRERRLVRDLSISAMFLSLFALAALKPSCAGAAGFGLDSVNGFCYRSL
jgi:hypothetical protein